MNIHGTIHVFPRSIRLLIGAFLVTLSIGFYMGIAFVEDTTSLQPIGIEQQYLGNENDEAAMVMKFKKSKHEMLTLIHTHILSMSMIFFIVSFLLATTSINKKFKQFLMVEPFVSLLLTFGGLYIVWMGVEWFSYIVMVSGILMTLSFTLAAGVILTQLTINSKLT